MAQVVEMDPQPQRGRGERRSPDSAAELCARDVSGQRRLFATLWACQLRKLAARRYRSRRRLDDVRKCTCRSSRPANLMTANLSGINVAADSSQRCDGGVVSGRQSVQVLVCGSDVCVPEPLTHNLEIGRRTLRDLRADEEPGGSPHPKARRPEPARQAGQACLDAPDGNATTQDPRDLSPLPQRHPRRSAHHDQPRMITGERGARKPARPVREETDGKGPEPRRPRRRSTSLDGRGLETERERVTAPVPDPTNLPPVACPLSSPRQRSPTRLCPWRSGAATRFGVLWPPGSGDARINRLRSTRPLAAHPMCRVVPLDHSRACQSLSSESR